MYTNIQVYPVTVDRWANLQDLFGRHGAYAGCWCMFWRLERAVFKKQKGEGNREMLKGMLQAGEVPGVLAYAEEQVVGWCSIAPRSQLAALENSRILKRIDDKPVWSITCFFVAKGFRGQGVMQALLEGAIALARQQGSVIVEGYPLDLDHPQLTGQKLTSYAGYMGVASVFRAVGFVEVGRASETQRIMRYECT